MATQKCTPIWVVLTDDHCDDSDSGTCMHVIVQSFADKHQALQWYYLSYMIEILERNRYGSFSSYMRLESYDDILDAIVNKHLELYKDPSESELETFKSSVSNDSKANYNELFEKFTIFSKASRVFMDAKAT